MIGRSLFKKETNIQLFVGLKVHLSTGELGVIDSAFGQSGKFKVHIPGKCTVFSISGAQRMVPGHAAWPRSQILSFQHTSWESGCEVRIWPGQSQGQSLSSHSIFWG